MRNRIIAVGDIHGHADALAALLQRIDLQPGNTLVTLGDYVDRGPDSKGVLDQLIKLESQCRLIPLMGNHEEMMLGAREGRDNFRFWMQFGGDTALESYGQDRNLRNIPQGHWEWLNRLQRCFETESHFFVHANYYPNLPFNEQSTATLLWRPLENDDLPGPHYSGKTAIVGHTPQMKGEILDLGHLKCIDTGCGHGGLLTALEVTSGKIWQVMESGQQP
jgi:serine/threonine protein phosphatase 1